MSVLARPELIASIEQVIALIRSGASEAELDAAIVELQRGCLDPAVSDYVFWREWTPDQIADRILEYRPIAL